MGVTNKMKEDRVPVVPRKPNPNRANMSFDEAVEDDRKYLETEAKIANYRKSLEKPEEATNEEAQAMVDSGEAEIPKDAVMDEPKVSVPFTKKANKKK